MKQIIAVLLLILPMCVVFANGANESSEAKPEGPISVDLYVWSNGDDDNSKLVDAYNAQATDVIINPKYISAADYESKLTTLLAGGMEMDIYFQKRQTDMFPHNANGYIEPLNNLIESQGFDFSTLKSWESALKVDEDILGLPFRAGKYYTYYNEKAFTDKGLPTPQQLVEKGEWTWDKFIELSQAVSENDGKTYGSCIYTWGSQQVFPATQKGVQFINADGTIDLDESVLRSVQLRKTLEDGQDMTPMTDLLVTKTHYSQVMYSGMAPMLIIGEWFAGMMHNAFKDGKVVAMEEKDFRITRMPSDSPMYNTVGAPTFGHISSRSKKKEAAFKVLSWYAGSEGALAAAKLGLLPPVVNSDIKEIISESVTDPASLEYFLEDVPVLPMFYNKYGSRVEQTISRFTEMYLLGEIAEVDYLSTMEKELQIVSDTTD
ncbi:MAG: extracellular solute-binding protein [Spirochaetaceae bacterium]